MPPPLPDHDCTFSEAALAYIAELEAQVSDLKHRLDVHERHRFGRRSEKMPTPGQVLGQDGPGADPEQTRALREERREAKGRLPRVRFEHPVAELVKACCPRCQAGPMRPLGQGEVTTVIEHVPARFIQHEHVVHKAVCPACEHIVTASSPVRRFGEQGQYGPTVVSDVVVSKTVDALPLHRLSARYDREGLRLHRNTMLDLFHRAAAELEPLYKVLLALIAEAGVVQADETVLKRQRGEEKGKAGNGWVWTFLTDDGVSPLIAYVYAVRRSGDTPARVLGDTQGVLVVDAFTSYNAVTTPDGRLRAGCLAHARRKIFDARKTAPEAADRGLALILEAYRVEHEAKERGIVRTAAHLALRQTRGRAAMEAVKAWAEAEQGQHLPRGPMGQALAYLLGHWTELTRYLDDPNIPIDNNASEGALRGIALGRKNFLFVGHETAGQNLAVLYSLVMTCIANGVNPARWLEDVLIRVQTWPADRIGDLLPHRWRPQDEAAAAPPATTSSDASETCGLPEPNP